MYGYKDLYIYVQYAIGPADKWVVTRTNVRAHVHLVLFVLLLLDTICY